MLTNMLTNTSVSPVHQGDAQMMFDTMEGYKGLNNVSVSTLHQGDAEMMFK